METLVTSSREREVLQFGGREFWADPTECVCDARCLRGLHEDVYLASDSDMVVFGAHEPYSPDSATRSAGIYSG